MTQIANEIPVEKQLSQIAAEMRDAIIALSAKAPTTGSSLLDQYLRLIAPSMASGGDSRFPVPLRRHRWNQERSTADSGRYGLLMFHIGSAIHAYYGAVLSKAVTPVLLRRSFVLGQIGKIGLDKFKTIGSDRDGFTLSYPSMDKALEKMNAVPDPKVAENGSSDNGGGGRTSVPPAPIHGRPGAGKDH